MLIINPGTKKQNNCTETNAIKSAKLFAEQLNIKELRQQAGNPVAF